MGSVETPRNKLDNETGKGKEKKEQEVKKLRSQAQTEQYPREVFSPLGWQPEHSTSSGAGVTGVTSFGNWATALSEASPCPF